MLAQPCKLLKRCACIAHTRSDIAPLPHGFQHILHISSCLSALRQLWKPSYAEELSCERKPRRLAELGAKGKQHSGNLPDHASDLPGYRLPDMTALAQLTVSRLMCWHRTSR